MLAKACFLLISLLHLTNVAAYNDQPPPFVSNRLIPINFFGPHCLVPDSENGDFVELDTRLILRYGNRLMPDSSMRFFCDLGYESSESIFTCQWNGEWKPRLSSAICYNVKPLFGQ